MKAEALQRALIRQHVQYFYINSTQNFPPTIHSNGSKVVLHLHRRKHIKINLFFSKRGTIYANKMVY